MHDENKKDTLYCLDKALSLIEKIDLNEIAEEGIAEDSEQYLKRLNLQLFIIGKVLDIRKEF